VDRRTAVGDELRIRISGLSNGLHEYQFSAVPADLGLDARFSGMVDVDAHLDKTTRQLYLKTDIRAAGRFECDRCLDQFERQLATTYGTMYVYDEIDSGGVPPDEVQVINPDTVSINLAEDVRQYVLLSVPLKLLCKDECRGLCPICGTNWNHATCDCSRDAIDSRWSGLKDLLKP
jgi:uncharacterized protein